MNERWRLHGRWGREDAIVDPGFVESVYHTLGATQDKSISFQSGVSCEQGTDL